MAVDGTYEITITTPMGTRTHTLILETNNNALDGTLTGPFGNQSISDGTINGNDISWSVELKPPRGFKAYLMRGFRSVMQGVMGGIMGSFAGPPSLRQGPRGGPPIGGPRPGGPPMMGPPPADMSLFFTGTVHGDDISGHVEIGPIGSVAFKGTRIKNPT
jgi:hypothetical protein